MFRLILRPALWLLFWFCITLYVSFPDGYKTEFYYCCGHALFPNAGIIEIKEYFGYSDPGSYARGGEALYLTGSALSPGAAPLWSPGMFWLYAMALKLVGPFGPVAGVVAIGGGVFWALFLTSLSLFARYCRPENRFYAFLPGALFLVPITTEQLLGTGLFFSETISISLFGIALVCAFHASRAMSFAVALLASGAFVGAMLFRYSFELVGHAIVFLIAAYWLGIWTLIRLRKSGFETKNFLDDFLRQKPLLLVFALLIVLTSAVYRGNNWVNHGSPQWAFADYYFVYPWMPSEEYTQVQQFVLAGGENIACQIRPKKCLEFVSRRRSEGPSTVSAREYSQELIRTAITHPVKWIKLKAPIVLSNFVDAQIGGVISAPTVFGAVLGFMVLFSFIVSLVAVFTRRALLPNIVYLGFLAANIATLMLVHVETRYLFGLVIIAPTFLLLSAFGAAPLRPGTFVEDRDRA